MQEAGYNTYYTGKLMNGHSAKTYNDPFPAGFNQTNCKQASPLKGRLEAISSMLTHLAARLLQS